MKFVFVVAALFLISCATSAARDRPPLSFIAQVTGSPDGRGVGLIDGRLMVYTARSEHVDASAKPYESIAKTFEIHKTAEGTQIILRPKGQEPSRQNSPNWDQEGYYLTGDYSMEKPSIKFTKTPEKYSYWEIPDFKRTGPIVNKNDLGKPAFLSMDPKPVFLTHYTFAGQMEHHGVTLSFEHTDDFRIDLFDPHDVGK